jgi:hypothetical protein
MLNSSVSRMLEGQESKTHLNLLALLIALAPLTSSTSPEGNLPSALHFFKASLEELSPTASTSENCLNPPRVSNCCLSASGCYDKVGKRHTWTGMAIYKQCGSDLTSSNVFTLATLLISISHQGREGLTKPICPRFPSWKEQSSRRMDSVC